MNTARWTNIDLYILDLLLFKSRIITFPDLEHSVNGF